MLIVMMMIMQLQLQMLMTRLMTLPAIEADQVQKLSTWQQTAPTGHLPASHYHPHDDEVDDEHDEHDDDEHDKQHQLVTWLKQAQRAQSRPEGPLP